VDGLSEVAMDILSSGGTRMVEEDIQNGSLCLWLGVITCVVIRVAVAHRRGSDTLDKIHMNIR
jgi:hypothetical protein